MVTTRRSTETANSYDDATAKGGVGLLERPITTQEKVSTQVVEENYTEASERMQRNLHRLLNYDRYSAEQMETVKEEVVSEKALSDEDIRPTSTTMQFGEDIDQIREEMKQSAVSEEATYHLNGKGKLVAILYSLAITVILALIVLNTGVLTNLSGTVSAKKAELNAAVAKYNQVQSEIADISDNDYIINVAKNDYGMIIA